MRHLKNHAAILFVLLLSNLNLSAQAPVINSISSQSTYPGDQIVIAGAGFNSDKSKMRVWFGSVAGTVLKSTAFSLEVLVPPGARVSNIEIINTATGLSVRSNNRFAPWFSGSGFSASAFATEQTTGSADFRQFISNGPEFYDVCACDFDGNGKPDLAATRYNIEQRIKILRNTSTVGNLSFAEQDVSTGTQVTDQIICGDLNGDGLPEIVASPSDKVNKNIITILPNRSSSGTITFGAAQQITLPSSKAYVRSIAIRDLNNDGKPELIVANSYKPDDKATAPDNISPVYIYMNQSSGSLISFSSPPMELLLPRYVGTYSVEIQDFDSNGLPDVAVAEFQDDNVYFFLNKSTNFISFDAPVTRQVAGARINKLASADLNNDGKPDLAVADFFNNQVDVFLNNSSVGSISFGNSIKNPVGLNPGGIDVADVDGDKDVDLVVACRGEAKVTVLTNNGGASPTFTRTDLTTIKNVRSLFAGDLDGDAKPDLALVSFRAPSFSLDVFRNKSCFVPAIINEAPITNCPGQSIKLETVPGYGVTYDWKKDATVVANTAVPSTNVSAAGAYSVTAIGECAAASATSGIVTLNTTPTGTITAQPVINGSTTLCEGSNLKLTTTSISDATYTWTGPNGFTSSTTSPELNRSGLIGSMSGEYSLQVQNKEGCKSEIVTRVVEVVSLSSFTIVSSSPANTICAGDGSQLTLSVANFSGYLYQWREGTTDIAGGTSAALPVGSPGSYTVQVSSAAVGGCTKTISPAVQVSVVSRPEADFKVPSPACTGNENVFEDTSRLGSAASLAEYSWNFGPGGTSDLKVPQKVNFPPGTTTVDVTLTLKLKGVDGCQSTKTIPLVVKQTVIPVIEPAELAVCPEAPKDLSVTGTFQSVLWSTGALTPVLSVKEGGDFSVTTTDVNGCKSTATRSVTGLPVPEVEVTADKQNVASGEAVSLTATGADTWQWEPAETLDDALSATPIARPLSTTKYFATGFLKDGCSAKDSVEVQVDGDIKLPNVFSPNGDGVNDFWELPTVESFTDCILAIFDRSGRRVFEQKGYSNNWDGNNGGRQLPEGVYYYVMGCPNRPPITGNVLLAR